MARVTVEDCLNNVENLTLENVIIEGQRVDGTLDWREAASSQQR